MLREGEPAPADTPIHVYQTTLYMDEEMALAAELGLLAAENVTVPGLLAAVRAAGVEVPLRAGVLDDLDDLEF